MEELLKLIECCREDSSSSCTLFGVSATYKEFDDGFEIVTEPQDDDKYKLFNKLEKVLGGTYSYSDSGRAPEPLSPYRSFDDGKIYIQWSDIKHNNKFVVAIAYSNKGREGLLKRQNK